MENYSVYEDIANRTGGDIYIGVVGPVRTGKSTFIKRFMELLVLPLSAENERGVMTDELPQSAAGKTIMTTEPKFVPAKAAKITITKGAEAYVRLVDCVGFGVDGAGGYEEDGAPRLVKTPWEDGEIPFEKAAELGTEKVIKEHSTIGVLVTTDGSVADIPRSAYVAAEERAVAELKEIGKPFVILLNCQHPTSQSALRQTLEEKYAAPVLAINVEEMTAAEVLEIMKTALFEFPVATVDVKIPAWLQSFPEDNPTVAALIDALKKVSPSLQKMRDCFALETLFEGDTDFLNPEEIVMELGKGRVEIRVGVKETLFYRVLNEDCGEDIHNELQLMQFVRSLSKQKERFDKVSKALEEAAESGYGIVYPTEEDYQLKKPALVKKNVGYGMQFNASATSYHIVKVDIKGSVSPIIGTKEQGEDFAAETIKAYDLGEAWDTNIFGKSLRSLIEGELSGKTGAVSIELRKKMRRLMTKIVNEGKNNLFYLLF
ncbi:MAG: stage IV sporulation protein A [Clostridiales bacterium]|nr:stage IV sporulation protein A [Clostridiales bacterium]